MAKKKTAKKKAVDLLSAPQFGWTHDGVRRDLFAAARDAVCSSAYLTPDGTPLTQTEASRFVAGLVNTALAAIAEAAKNGAHTDLILRAGDVGQRLGSRATAHLVRNDDLTTAVPEIRS